MKAPQDDGPMVYDAEHGVPPPPEPDDIAPMPEYDPAHVATLLVSLKGAPITPFVPDALALWALERMATNLPALIATGFVLAYILPKERSPLVQAVAWPLQYESELRVAEMVLPKADVAEIRKRLIAAYPFTIVAKVENAVSNTLTAAEQVAALKGVAIKDSFITLVRAAAQKGGVK